MTDVLAAKLRSIGVTKNSMVGIMMERCLEYTISYIAIHKAGTYIISDIYYLFILYNFISKGLIPIIFLKPYRGRMFNLGGILSITTSSFGFRRFDSQSNPY